MDCMLGQNQKSSKNALGIFFFLRSLTDVAPYLAPEACEQTFKARAQLLDCTHGEIKKP
jgi:hypothetical protein